MNRKGQRGKSG